MKERTYLAIDLKSFYASVECIERGLDPMTTNLVVADNSRTEKTICLAVSPSLKSFGIPGRPRLFEVVQKVKEANYSRRADNNYRNFERNHYDIRLLNSHPEYGIDYIVAVPQMAKYIEYSTRIYNIYLDYVSRDDIHVYSIDEVFMDVTDYLPLYKMTADKLAMKIILDVLYQTGITATAGIGTNLYLAKVAMDIVAKHIPPDENGVRIAQLDEFTYRQLLWDHRPLTDFWRVGKGYSKKLEGIGLYTMGDIARCSLGGPGDVYNEDLLYKMFGVNAELLIDHAWGYEPCTMSHIKNYKSENKSVGAGQVLHEAYTYEKAKIIVAEMVDSLAMELLEKGLVCDSLVLTVGYDIQSLDENSGINYTGEIKTDHYGRKVPKHAHGTGNMKGHTNSLKLMTACIMEIYKREVNPDLLIRRVSISANHVIPEKEAASISHIRQMDMFTDYSKLQQQEEKDKKRLEKEKNLQHAILDLKKKYGKNVVLKGMNFQEGATMADRNGQIGGHKA